MSLWRTQTQGTQLKAGLLHQCTAMKRLETIANGGFGMDGHLYKRRRILIMFSNSVSQWLVSLPPCSSNVWTLHVVFMLVWVSSSSYKTQAVQAV